MHIDEQIQIRIKLVPASCMQLSCFWLVTMTQDTCICDTFGGT